MGCIFGNRVGPLNETVLKDDKINTLRKGELVQRASRSGLMRRMTSTFLRKSFRRRVFNVGIPNTKFGISPELSAELVVMFDMLDKNKDGKLEKKELIRYLQIIDQTYSGLPKAQRSKVLQKFIASFPGATSEFITLTQGKEKALEHFDEDETKTNEEEWRELQDEATYQTKKLIQLLEKMK